MTTLYENFLSGIIMDDPLSNFSTTINSMGFASIPAIVFPDIMWIVLDPTGTAGAPEIVMATDHIAFSTRITCLRAQQSTVAREHEMGIDWVVSITKADLDLIYTGILDDVYARDDELEAHIAIYDAHIAAVNPHVGNIFATVAARDAASNIPYGTRVFVQSTRTEYLRDGQPVGGPITLNGTSSANQYISTPDHASLDFTGDFEIVVRVALDDWTNGIGQVFVSKDDVVGTRTYTFYIGSSGLLNLEVWPMGANTASAVQSFVDGTTYWIKVTYDVNNGAAGHDAKFYWAPDNVNEPSGGGWTQIGTTITTAGTTAGAVNNTALWVGARPNSTGDVWSAGKFYRVIMRSPIGGTVYLDMNSANVAANLATFDSNLKTFTLNNLGPGWVVMSEPEQTYVPSLYLITLGTVTGQNIGRFWRSNGFVDIALEVQLGTGGVLGADPAIPLPTGIMSANVLRNALKSTFHDSDAGTVISGGSQLMAPGQTYIRPFVNVTTSTYELNSGVNATIPFTWAVNDRLTIVGRIPMQSRYM